MDQANRTQKWHQHRAERQNQHSCVRSAIANDLIIVVYEAYRLPAYDDEYRANRKLNGPRSSARLPLVRPCSTLPGFLNRALLPDPGKSFLKV